MRINSKQKSTFERQKLSYKDENLPVTFRNSSPLIATGGTGAGNTVASCNSSVFNERREQNYRLTKTCKLKINFKKYSVILELNEVSLPPTVETLSASFDEAALFVL